MRPECKESLRLRQPPCNEQFCNAVTSDSRAVANITIIRRQNMLALFQAFAERAMAKGDSPKGLEQAFAESIHVSASMWSQIKSSRPVGDKLARQIEAHADKASGWLDEAHASTVLSKTEDAFLTLALAAYREVSRGERRALVAQLKALRDQRA
jgi:hypothetical protein